MMVIEKVIVEGGRELINVPASRDVLEEMNLPQEQIEELLLDCAKKTAKQNIQTFAKAARTSLAKNADQYLVASWSEKSARAQRVVSGTALEGDIEILEAEATKRNRQESAEDLAKKQLGKAQVLAKASAIIEGMENAALKEVDKKRALHTLEELVNNLQQEAKTELEKLL